MKLKINNRRKTGKLIIAYKLTLFWETNGVGKNLKVYWDMKMEIYWALRTAEKYISKREVQSNKQLHLESRKHLNTQA